MLAYLNVFEYVLEVSQRRTRNSNSNVMHIPRAKAECNRLYISVSGSTMWNALTEDIRTPKSIVCFSRQIILDIITILYKLHSVPIDLSFIIIS